MVIVAGTVLVVVLIVIGIAFEVVAAGIAFAELVADRRLVAAGMVIVALLVAFVALLSNWFLCRIKIRCI